MKERPRAITGELPAAVSTCHFSIIVNTLHKLAVDPLTQQHTVSWTVQGALGGQMLMEWVGFWRAPLIL